jgi:hypothetical protein
VDRIRVRIEADAELTPEEVTAVRAALERYAATSGSAMPASGDPAPWAGAARPGRARRRDVSARTGGRAEWQAARDRRRRTREAQT